MKRFSASHLTRFAPLIPFLGLLLLPQVVGAFCLDGIDENKLAEIAMLPDRGNFDLPEVDRAAFRRAKLQGEIDELTKQIAREGKTAERLAERGKLYLEAGAEDRAKADYDAAVQMDGDHVAYREARMKLNRGIGKYDLVEADLTKLIELDKTAERYLERGKFYVDRWDPKKAVEDFTAAIKLDPNLAEAYANRASVEFNEAKRDIRFARRVQDDLEMAVKLNGDLIQARRDLLIVYMSLSRHAEAVEQATAILEQIPEDPCARHYRSKSNRLRGRFDLALEDANKLLERIPEGSKFIVERALIYRDMGQTEKAIEDYQLAIKVNPGNHATHAFLARFLLSNKRFEEAIDHYQQAIELNKFQPGLNAEFYSEMANANFWVGNLEESQQNYETASELAPESVSYQLSRGDVLCQMKRFDEALSLYETMMTQHPNHLASFERRARVYIVLGDLEKAKADMDHYLSKIKHSGEGHLLRARISKLQGDEEAEKADLARAEEIRKESEERKEKIRKQMESQQ